MHDCVFCKIYKNEIPSHRIYKDEVISCFLPKDLEAYGHLLIVPNNHYENIFDIPENELSHIIKFAKKMALEVKEKLGATGVNIVHSSGADAEQTVFHFHIHILPRFKDDGINLWPQNEKPEFNKEEILQKLSCID